SVYGLMQSVHARRWKLRDGCAGAKPCGGAADNLSMGGVFTLVCRDRRGREVRLSYDPHTSSLTDEAGAPVVPEEPGGRFEAAPRVSPASPGRKSSAPQTLKIQLGLKCNYTCS